ncbi:MAG: homocysteine S-methyltransferase family protein [Bilophila wadsworthia]
MDAAGRKPSSPATWGRQFARPLGTCTRWSCEALREQARGLVEGGVDLFLIETQFDLAEVRIAVAAIRAESDLPIMVSMTFEQGTSLTGTTPEIFAETMQNLGVDALGLNCGLGPEQMAPLMERFLACSSVPVLAEPNAGLPELVTARPCSAFEPFAERRRPRRHGRAACGRLLGTTLITSQPCGFAVDAVGPPPLLTPSGIVLTTRTRLVRVSPPSRSDHRRTHQSTGKKDLQAELQAGEYGLAMRFSSGSPGADPRRERGRAHGRRGAVLQNSCSADTPNRFPSTPRTRKPLPRPCRSAPVPRW